MNAVILPIGLLSPELDLSIGMSAHSRLFGSMSLTAFDDAELSFRPSNIEGGFMYSSYDSDTSVIFGVSVSAGVGAVREGRAENFAAGRLRGFVNPWRWMPDTLGVVAHWGLEYEVDDESVRGSTTLDLAPVFSLADDGAGPGVAWQAATDLSIELIERVLVLRLAAGLVHPGERLLGAESSVILYAEPELQLRFWRVGLSFALNFPLLGPIPAVWDEGGALAPRTHLSIGF